MHSPDTFIWSDYLEVQAEATRFAGILEHEVEFSRCQGGWRIHHWVALSDMVHDRECILKRAASGELQREHEEQEREREYQYKEREREESEHRADESRQYHANEQAGWQRGLARSDESGWFYAD